MTGSAGDGDRPLFPECVPNLTDGELPAIRLRAHRPADVVPFFEMCSDPGYQRWTNKPLPYQRDHAEHFVTELIPDGWRTGEIWGWAIEFRGRFAGNIDLGGADGRRGEIGFGLAAWARGYGVMPRAVRLVVRYALETLGWEAVVWRAVAGNWASRRVAWKAGFSGFTTVSGGTVHRGVTRDEWIATVGPGDVLEPREPWPGQD